MARTNFCKEVYGEGNYQDLLLEVGCQYKTRGMLLVAWELAQKYWLEHKAVPEAKWPLVLEVLLRHGFAREETRENGRFIYVAGSAEHCSFLEKLKVSGRKGGLSKSKKKTRTLRQYAENSEASPKHSPKPHRSAPKQNVPSYSYSISNSIKIPKTSSSGESLPAIALLDGGKVSRSGKNAVALWMEAYHRRYQCRYPALGKDHGTLINLEKTYSGEQLEILFACYLAIKEPLYESQKHPLSLFFRDLPKISVAAQTGVDPLAENEPEWKKEAREAERKANGSG